VLPGGDAFTLAVFTQGKWAPDSLIMLPEIGARAAALMVAQDNQNMR
jgi:hypothetical protein